MTKKTRIPEFKSRKQEARFWDTHSFTDFPDQTKRVKVKFDLKKQKEFTITIRLQPDVRKLLDQTAIEFGVNSSTLARMWLIEKLKQTIKASAGKKD